MSRGGRSGKVPPIDAAEIAQFERYLHVVGDLRRKEYAYPEMIACLQVYGHPLGEPDEEITSSRERR